MGQNNPMGVAGSAKGNATGGSSDSLTDKLARVSATGAPDAGSPGAVAPPPLPNSPTGKLGPTTLKGLDSLINPSLESDGNVGATAKLKTPSNPAGTSQSSLSIDTGLSLDPDSKAPSGSPAEPDGGSDAQRRSAKRRPSGPVRRQVAANDDAPSIGGLIYALEQKPSSAPFRYAAYASVIWGMLGGGFTAFSLYGNATAGSDLSAVLLQPQSFLLFSAVVVPIAVIWFLAVLAWRSEELHLRSSTMTEVAMRLAEPDRMAEDSVASLGQAVRRQVSFMNDAVSRALGRAGELEALVHNEVTALERSYEQNERKIRGLIDELSGERFELLDTSERIVKTLDHVGSRVPELLESLSGQQQKLAHIIEGAGDNLEMLETSLTGRTEHLQTVLTDYTGAMDTALESRTDAMQTMLADYSKTIDDKLVGEHERIDTVLGGYTDKLGESLETQNARMQAVLEDYTTALATALGARSDDMQLTFENNMQTLDSSIAERTETLQDVFEAYAQALDTTIAQRAESLNMKLVERTQALDDAFSNRLQLFDEAIYRSTSAIDSAVGERANALSGALENHAREFKETITLQAADLDESMAIGINAVRRSSENITRHSIKAIEGIASQSDLLKNVSENLLTQINSVTNRFDSQGQTIMKAASALESANFKIDQTLQNRHAELAQTLDRMSGKAEEFGKFLEGYSSTIEGTLGEAETRARAVAEELKTGTQVQQRAVLDDLERLRSETDNQSRQALDQVRQRFTQVSDEVSSQLGSLTTQIDETSEDVRRKAEAAALSVSTEQQRLRAQVEDLPETTQKNTEAMRRALQDQLRALDDLSQFTARGAATRDIQPPVGGPQGQGGGQSSQRAAPPTNASQPLQAAGQTPSAQTLSSLSTNLAREISERADAGRSEIQSSNSAGRPQLHGGSVDTPIQSQAPHPVRPDVPAAVAPQSSGGQHLQTAQTNGRADPWSVGDLLKNASDGTNGRENGHPAGGGGLGVDLRRLAEGLAPERAMDIWNRLRAGQRGFMSVSSYTPDGQRTFQELSERHAKDPGLQQTITTYLSDFEGALRSAEQSDPSGTAVSQQLVSEGGRVYLILAHASGRLH